MAARRRSAGYVQGPTLPRIIRAGNRGLAGRQVLSVPRWTLPAAVDGGHLFGMPHRCDVFANPGRPRDRPLRHSGATQRVAPLAERLRPHTIDEVIGQRHLLAPGKPLAVAFASGKLHSMILWGPPGVGKTTLARLMANAFNAEFIALSAVLSGVKDIREAVARAEATLAPVGPADDPVRRRGASLQQGAAGRVPAVRRAGHGHLHRRHHREPVVRGERRAAVAGGRVRAGTARRPTISPSSARSRACAGRAGASRSTPARARRARRLRRRRRAAARQPGRATGGGRASRPSVRPCDLAFVEATIARSLRRFDKGGEAFYDQISALHKSVRGSDPDAALYWMCRMLDGGADPLYVARRIDPHGGRGHRARRSARAAHRARRGGDLRAAGLARGRARAGRMRALSRRGAEVATPSTSAYNAARAFIAEDGIAPGAACTCAMRRRSS